MKLQQLAAVLLTVVTLGPVMTVPANAASTIPKKYRGTWVSKVSYIPGKRHTKKNISIPKMKIIVYRKTAKWHFVGTLTREYDHKVHTFTSPMVGKDNVQLKGHGPFGSVNLLARQGSKLDYAYQMGGSIKLSRVK